jgi:hypothetical protein
VLGLGRRQGAHRAAVRGGRQLRGALEQRERVAERLGDDPVADRLV